MIFLNEGKTWKTKSKEKVGLPLNLKKRILEHVKDKGVI